MNTVFLSRLQLAIVGTSQVTIPLQSSLAESQPNVRAPQRHATYWLKLGLVLHLIPCSKPRMEYQDEGKLRLTLPAMSSVISPC